MNNITVDDDNSKMNIIDIDDFSNIEEFDTNYDVSLWDIKTNNDYNDVCYSSNNYNDYMFKKYEPTLIMKMRNVLEKINSYNNSLKFKNINQLDDNLIVILYFSIIKENEFNLE